MNLLNLPDWTVDRVEESAHDYRVHARYSMEPASCPSCPGSLFPKLYRHGSWSQLVMDLPIHGKRVGVQVKRARYRCQDCGRTFLQPLPDVDERASMTKRLVSYIEKESLRRTFTSVAEDVGVDEKTVRNVFAAYVAYLDATVTFQTPEAMGLDEVHLLRKPRCVVTNVKERTIVGVLADRNKRSVVAHLRGLPGKERVKIVTMDMWTPYRDAVLAELPDAAIVVDKFHVVRMANQCLEAVRKEVRRSLSDSQRKRLMHDRFLLLRRPKDLDDVQRQKRDAWLADFPLLAEAYRLKEAFYGVYTAKTKADALEAWNAWEASMSREAKEAFRPLLTATHNWQEHIFAYFDHRQTNACTEALNGIAKAVNRLGRGYTFKVIRAKMLYARNLQKRPRYGQGWEPPPPPSGPDRLEFPDRGELEGKQLPGTDIVALLLLVDPDTTVESVCGRKVFPTSRPKLAKNHD